MTQIQRYTGSGALDACQTVTYAYDTNPYDTTGKYQNTMGRLTAALYPLCHVPDSQNVTVTEMYSYVAGAGCRSRICISTSRGMAATPLWYDARGDVEADCGYNAARQETGVTLPTESQNPPGPTVLPITYPYGYDGMGRVNSMSDNDPNSVSGNGNPWVQNVQYDFAGVTHACREHI